MNPEEQPVSQQLGKRLATLRNERGRSHLHLANILGRSQQQVLSVEKCLRRLLVSSVPDRRFAFTVLDTPLEQAEQ